MFYHDNRKVATMKMKPLDKLAPEILLSVASFLPIKDVRALSRTCRKIHAICEIQLYASIDFEMKDSSDASTDKRLVRFYGSLMSRKERCTYVQHLSLDFSRTFTSRDHALVSAIVEALPCIRTFIFSYSNVDFSDDDFFNFPQSMRSRHAIIKSSFRTLKATILSGRQKRSPSHRTVATRRPFEERSSLLNLTWLNRNLLEASFLVSFVRLHSNIRFLHLEHATNFPKMDASILPNLESVKAPISVVLALLPGRKIQRGGLPIEIPTLRKTKVQLLRLHHGADQPQALDLFRAVKTLQCIEWLHVNVVDDGQPGWLILYTASRLYGNGKWIPHVQWKCEPGDEWLGDWKDVHSY
ncbi:hypothetical protein EYR40_007404 [Pleurotus pulmonarius]|nr:hypothetical protein EYR36_008240 [Pleurotus pulmonarius]KAF4579998.1 hypothetical protein EYR36_001818 [Pleurotus pulmonarius]KAF4596954.1 hypothetical protein EYR40_007404 [Pleurotus pulmonarius]